MQNEIALSRTTNDRIRIADELRRLYALQDKSPTGDKIEYITDELENAKYPLGAIIQGLRSLHRADIRQIKLATIEDAVRHYIIQDKPEQCEYCETVGLINMVDEDSQPVALACQCKTGQVKTQKQGVASWNGQPKQYINGRWLYQWDAKHMGEKFYYEMIASRRKRMVQKLGAHQ